MSWMKPHGGREGGEGGGVYSGFKLMRMCKWGPKRSHAEFSNLKNTQKGLNDKMTKLSLTTRSFP